MSRPKYFIKTTVTVPKGRNKYEVVRGFSEDDLVAKAGSERDATMLCEEFEHLTDEITRLKTEVDNANRINTELLALSNRQASDIRMLRKAGDAMACHLVCSDLPNDVCHDLMKNWNAAKEGEPSV